MLRFKDANHGTQGTKHSKSTDNELRTVNQNILPSISRGTAVFHNETPRLLIRFYERFEQRLHRSSERLHRLFDEARNIKERNLIVQKQCHGLFVGRIENGRRSAAYP